MALRKASPPVLHVVAALFSDKVLSSVVVYCERVVSLGCLPELQVQEDKRWKGGEGTVSLDARLMLDEEVVACAGPLLRRLRVPRPDVSVNVAQGSGSYP